MFRPDYLLFIIIVVLISWGFFTLSCVSFPISLEKFGNSWYFVLHQLLYGIIPGILVGFIFYKINLKILKKIIPYLFGLNLILLFLVFFPKIGVEIQGARRWLDVGPILFQPTELLKITFLIYISAWLSNLSQTNKSVSAVMRRRFACANWTAPFVFLTIIIMLGIILLFQPDFSTFSIIFFTGLIVYFVSSTPWWHSFVIVLISGGLGAFLIKISPYRLARVMPVFNPDIDPLGIGYQLKQALIAIGSGRWFGIEQGFSLGLSRQKFGFLPHSLTDSIFAIIGEEVGFFGSLILIILFLLLVWRGIKISLNSDVEFNKLLGIGISFWIMFQAFCNIGGIIGILPLAGIPLPFFSYGASHLIVEMAGMGILLNISRRKY